MRVCLFTPTFLPLIGGAEVVLDALAGQFHAKGHHVVVLAHGEPAALDVPYAVHWYRKPPMHRFFPERIGRHLAALNRRERFDLIATIYGVPNGYAAVQVGRRAGVPVVIGSQGGDLYRSSMRRRHPHLWKRLIRAYREADGLIAISPYMEELIREINPNPRCLELIPNGIDLAVVRRPAPRPADFADERPFCLCLGNLGPMKGFDDAIEAFGAVRQQMDPTILLIVGSGKLESVLREQVRARELDRHVLFLGTRTGDDKHWLLQNCRFGIVPSLEEGHPIVGLEFLAVGKPVICSTNAAFDGMYEHDVNALRVPAQQPQQLAEAIVQMDGADLEAMGRVSRERAGRYEWSKIADRYLEFFTQLIEAGSPERCRADAPRPRSAGEGPRRRRPEEARDP